MNNIRLSPQVARKMALERAIELLGRKWLLHPANKVQRLPQPRPEWRKS